MIVSNHQNSLNDALALVIGVGKRGKRKVRSIARADAFTPTTKKLFRWLGIIPIFRMNYDGAETLSNNSPSFDEASNEILEGGAVIIYPEAGHQDKHWLGTFTYGYSKMVFDAAEASNFQKEIYILPSCNHYEDYFDVQTDMLIRFGTPIAISPFYELYKTKPRTAQRQVNALVREQISSMMLNITDLDNYDAINFIRNTYGIQYAREKGFDPGKLPEKLEADKLLFQELEEKKQHLPEKVKALYDHADFLSKGIGKFGITDSFFDKKPSWGILLLKSILLIALFPLFATAVILNGLIIFPPGLINKKIKDVMLHGTIRVILSALVTAPLTCIILLILVWAISKSLIAALVAIVSLPILFIFAVYYYKMFNKLEQEMKFKYLWAKGRLNELATARQRMYEVIKNTITTHKS